MRYSERVQSVIRFARQEAARLGHDHISTGHLLLGLIREGEGAAIIILEDAKVDLEEMKAELESVMESKGRNCSVIGQLQLTSRANNALRLADEESQNMGDKCVGTEHLLIGIIREREGVASKTLAKFGIDLDGARSAAQAIAVSSEEPSETLTFRNVDVTVPVPVPEPRTDYPPATPEKEVLNLEEVSQLLGITVDDLSRLLETEDLPGRMIAGRWRFSRSALIRWLGEGSSRSYRKNGSIGQ
jgi:ATP-dependent Clp protease ATP-binding subunit ClpC